MQSQIEVQGRYQAALDALVARLKQDRYVLAAVLYGSLARGEAWERSDIDLTIILRDEERAAPYRYLTGFSPPQVRCLRAPTPAL